MLVNLVVTHFEGPYINKKKNQKIKRKEKTQKKLKKYWKKIKNIYQ
jgi:ribonuclease HI